MGRRAVAILGGTGRQGRGLAQRLARRGYEIVVGSRDPDGASRLVRGWPVPAGSVRTASYGDAVGGAGVIVITTPFDAVARTLDEQRPRFAPGIIVDVTVPVVFTAGKAELATVAEGSAAEHVRAHVPAQVRVAAAFKTLPAHLLGDIERPLDCDEFVCGDSAEARAAAVELVEAIDGLRAIDVGSLSRARSIEHLTLLAIGIDRRHKVQDARFRVVGV